MNDTKNGPLRHTFNATGRSPLRFSVRDRTLTINGSDAFSIDAEVSHDVGLTWTTIKNFADDVVENFEWLGRDALISFNCTVFTTNPVELIFE